MRSWIRNLVYGLISWAVPFAVSFGFVDRTGQFLVDVRFFKSIMFVVATLTAAILLVSYFKHIKADYLREGVALGLTWLVINLVLDIVVLVPLMGVSFAAYFTQIGFGYLAIPIITIMLGWIVQQHASK